MKIAPSRLTARTATTVSGSIGRRIPTRSPASTPRPRSCSAARRTRPASSLFVSSAIDPSSPSHVMAMPSGSRTARGSTAAHDQSNEPPIHHRVHAGPPEKSAMSRGRRCQATPMSSTAAPQNHAGSATARVWRASSDASPVDRRKRDRRASAASAGSGRQATSGASRPKTGQSSPLVRLTPKVYGATSPWSASRAASSTGSRPARTSAHVASTGMSGSIWSRSSPGAIS